MRKLLAALVVMLSVWPAYADMYQDASNSKLPQARENLGLGPSVSIADYGADPSGATSSEAAFTSCITSGKDCRVPAGTYLLGCNTHIATAGTAIVGDGAKVSILKLPAACAIGPWSVLQASEVRDLTVDVNNATSAAAVVVALTPGARPKAERINVINGTTGMHLIGLVTAGVSVTHPVISHNYLHLAAPSTGGNHCVLFSNSGGGTITGGSIDNNICVNTAMIVRANGLSITDNDISGWNYGGGIVTEAASGSSKYLIARNRLHDSGTLLDIDNTAATAVENWAPDTVVIDNHCWNLGGACVANGGLRALVANNRATGMGKHDFPAGLGAFSSGWIDADYNASGSLYAGNQLGSDGSAIPVWGYQEQIGGHPFTGIVVSGNEFGGATSGRVDLVNLNPSTKIDALSRAGVVGSQVPLAVRAAPSFEFTQLDTVSYSTFRLTCTGVRPGAGVTDIGVQVGTGATTWFTGGYSSALTGTHTGAAAALVRVAGSGPNVPINLLPLLTSGAFLAHFDVNFGNFESPGFAKFFTIGAGYQVTPSAMASSFGGGAYAGGTDVLTAIRVISVGGNLDYGTCRLYGLI